MGCAHTLAASDAQIEAYRAASRLLVAVRAGQSHFSPECETCHAGVAPICCLECSFVGCAQHDQSPNNQSTSCQQHTDKHTLGILFTRDCDSLLWCFACKDVIVDLRLQEAARESAVSTIAELDDEGASNDYIDFGKPPQNIKFPDQPFHAYCGLRGLVNLGATCYASAVLQSLVHNPLVRAYFLSGAHSHELCERRHCLACGVDLLYVSIFASPSVSGYGITDLLVSMAEKQPVMGAGATEQDAHEFLLVLLNEFHGARDAAEPALLQASQAAHGGGALGTWSEDASVCGCVAHRNFGGSIQSNLACECGHEAVRTEPTVDLGLNLVPGVLRTNLEECLNRFVASERVSHYTCAACKRMNTTTKQLRIAQPPPVLLIQLKRFKHQGSRGSSKIDTPVDFPLQLDLAPYMAETKSTQSLEYELYGVICHSGTLDTGHYTCMMKHSSGQWFEFDDAMVTAVDVDAVRTVQRAYLLFYIVKYAL